MLMVNGEKGAIFGLNGIRVMSLNECRDFSECLVLCATASGSGSNLNASAADSEDGLGVTHSTNFTGIMPQAVNRDWQGAVPVLLITIS